MVWGKELLFPRLFGKPEEVSDLDTDAQQDGAGASRAVATPSGFYFGTILGESLVRCWDGAPKVYEKTVIVVAVTRARLQ